MTIFRMFMNPSLVLTRPSRHAPPPSLDGPGPVYGTFRSLVREFVPVRNWADAGGEIHGPETLHPDWAGAGESQAMKKKDAAEALSIGGHEIPITHPDK